MTPDINVFWKTAIDFRDFDISVPNFSYQNNNFRTIDRYLNPDVTFDDQLTLNAGGAIGQNNWFLGTSITRSSQTITGGTIGMYVDRKPGGFDGYIMIDGGSPAIDLNSVIDSASTVDDIAFLRSMLSGDDYMELSGGFGGVATDDYAFGAGGNDVIHGNGGKDTLLGDAGADALYGDAGADKLFGGYGADYLSGGIGNDVLTGGRNNDQIYGGSGADDLRGGKGNDYLSGGTGADEYIFRKNDGNDTITGWQDGIDKIRIEAPGGTNAGTFSKSQMGADCILTNTTLNIEITLLNTNQNTISIAGDFILVGL